MVPGPVLVEMFRELPLPDEDPDEGTLAGIGLPSQPSHKLAKARDGTAALLFHVPDAGRGRRPPPIVLEHVSLQHDVRCSVSMPGGGRDEGVFSIVRCRTADPDLEFYFLTVMADFARTLGPLPTHAELSQGIDELARLFAAMAAPPRSSVRGLWAELFVIAQSGRPEVTLASWRGEETDRYDFAEGNQRLEVKGSATRVRKHHFSLEQLHPPRDVDLLVASVFVERASGGLSVLELADKIRGRVRHADLLMALDTRVAEAIGNQWRTTTEGCYDQRVARDSLQFYDAQNVPALRYELPPGVSEVRFTSDLSMAPPADLSEYRSRGGLFEAVL